MPAVSMVFLNDFGRYFLYFESTSI